MLPHLSYLSQTFQLGSLNFPRISPTIDTEKMKLQEVYIPDKVLAELDTDLSEDRRQPVQHIFLGIHQIID